MSHAAKSTPGHNGFARRGICEEAKPTTQVEILQQAPGAHGQSGAAHNCIKLCFARAEGDYALGGRPGLDEMLSVLNGSTACRPSSGLFARPIGVDTDMDVVSGLLVQIINDKPRVVAQVFAQPDQCPLMALSLSGWSFPE